MHPAPAAPRRRLRAGVRRMRRAVLARRRPIAAVLAAMAVLAGVRAVEPPPPPAVGVLVARHDLAGGTTLRPADLASVAYPVDAVPDGTLDAVADAGGRVLAAPLRRGEPVTDVRLVAPGLLEGYPGSVALPVRVADPGAVALLAVGDRVDLIGASPETGTASVVVPDAPVVAIPDAAAHTDSQVPGTPVSGGLVVVAVSETGALRLAEASVSAVLSVALSR